MDFFDSIKRVLSNKKRLIPQPLTDIVKKKSHTGLGAFIDLNNDLGLMIEEESNKAPAIVMPYFYARRVANAGMYAQGIIDKSAFDRVNMLFYGYMIQVGKDLTKNEQVKFQEASFTRALELLSKYMFGITKHSAALLVSAAVGGVSLRDALLGGLDQEHDAFNEVIEPVMCYDRVLNHEYCLGYFASGWWDPGCDIEATSVSLFKYFKSQNINFEPQANEPGSGNYIVTSDGFVVQDSSSGHRLEVEFDGNMFHGFVVMPEQDLRFPLQPWAIQTNPFQDDSCFEGNGTKGLETWWFSIEPSSPFSEILAEVEALHSDYGANHVATFINSKGLLVPITGKKIDPDSRSLDGPEFSERLKEFHSMLYELSKRSTQKTFEMRIRPCDGSFWEWNFKLSDEELDLANEIASELYDYAQGWIVAPTSPLRKSER